MVPTGLYYISAEDFANTSIKGSDIIASLDELPWNSVTASENSRRYQHFGSTYDYVRRVIIPEAQAIPAFLEPLREFLSEACKEQGLPSEFNQVIVNDYLPGQGISKHTDIKAYGPVIGCFTFGSGATMTFRKGDDIFHQYVEADSLYVMSGESRTSWTHEMPSRKSDTVNGKKIERSRRVSVTFRYAPPS